MKTTLSPTACPACKAPNDAHTSRSNRSPADGDLAICFRCTYVGIFQYVDGALTVRHPTPEESAGMQDNPGLLKILAALSRKRE